MKYAIFGAGADGKKVFQYLGSRSVLCFIDNYVNEDSLLGKEVFSLATFLSQYRDDVNVEILIASSKYGREMEAEVQASAYKRMSTMEMELLPRVWRKNTELIPCLDEIIPDERIAVVNSVAIYKEDAFTRFITNHIRLVNQEIKISIVNDMDQLSQFDLVLVNVPKYESNVRETLMIADVDFIDLLDFKRCMLQFNNPQLIRFKNIHEGKRIFVIGNGPSMRIEDLETLWKNKEITIGANKLFRIYDKTDFRATYLGFADARLIEDCRQLINDLPGIKFVNDIDEADEKSIGSGTYYFTDILEAFLPNKPGFSDDITRGVFWGGSVTYEVGIQFAAYMGASEIYLVGVDHRFVGEVTSQENHFIKDYFEENGKLNHDFSDAFQKEKLDKAYEMAELYSRTHGFRIFNATRGGDLEVFERVSFDELFENDK